MRMIMWLALRVDAPAPDAEQTWLFEGDVPCIPLEGSDVLVLSDIPEGVRVKRMRYLRTQQAYEVILDEMDLDESGIPDEESYALLEAAGWHRVDQSEQSHVVQPSARIVAKGAHGDLTAQQAARELGVTDRRISQLCTSGALAGSKDGNDHWVIPREALAAYQNELKELPPDGRRRNLVVTAQGPIADYAMSAHELQNLSAAENIPTLSQLLIKQELALDRLADGISDLASRLGET